MSSYKSIDSLFSFGLSDINKFLRKVDKRLSISWIDSQLTGKPGGKVLPTGGMNITITRGNSSINFVVSIYKDSEGLYLLLLYKIGDSPISEYRYKLVKKESNLKPGTYRYYILDPYSLKPDTLCTRLYFLPVSGEFVTRSLLKDWGILYAQQKKGKADRYYFGYKKPPGEDKLKYRKSHYRGKITPFWRRYEELVERDRYREVAYLLVSGYGLGLFPPGITAEVRKEHKRVTGHSPRRAYPWG